MGFFSRLFRPRADGQPLSEDWTSLPPPPDEQASELVLYGEDAGRVMARFDIDAVIVTHERWLPWLEQALQGERDARLQPQVVMDDRSSELGRWLHGNGRQALGQYPAFDMLLRRHRFFHEQAAAMLMHLDNREPAKAEQAFKGCQHSSRQVVLLLKELQRGLEHVQVQPGQEVQAFQ